MSLLITVGRITDKQMQTFKQQTLQNNIQTSVHAEITGQSRRSNFDLYGERPDLPTWKEEVVPFRTRVPGAKDKPRRLIVLRHPSLYTFILLYFIFSFYAPVANALLDTEIDKTVADSIVSLCNSIKMFFMIFGAAIILSMLFTFYMCTMFGRKLSRIVDFGCGTVTAFGGAMHAMVDDTRTRLHKNADDSLWWYKCSKILDMSLSLVKLYTGVMGGTFSGCENVKFHREGNPRYGYQDRFTDNERYDKKKRESKGWIYSLLCAVGIGYWACTGGVPPEVKDGIFAFSRVHDAWKFVSSVSAKCCDYFKTGHIPGCTCTICEVIDETVGSTFEGIPTPFDRKVDPLVEAANKRFDQRNIFPTSQEGLNNIIIDDGEDDFENLQVPGVDVACIGCGLLHMTATAAAKCLARSSTMQHKKSVAPILNPFSDDICLDYDENEFDLMSSRFVLEKQHITPEDRKLIYKELKYKQKKHDTTFQAALRDWCDKHFTVEKLDDEGSSGAGIGFMPKAVPDVVLTTVDFDPKSAAAEREMKNFDLKEHLRNIKESLCGCEPAKNNFCEACPSNYEPTRRDRKFIHDNFISSRTNKVLKFVPVKKEKEDKVEVVEVELKQQVNFRSYFGTFMHYGRMVTLSPMRYAVGVVRDFCGTSQTIIVDSVERPVAPTFRHKVGDFMHKHGDSIALVGTIVFYGAIGIFANRVLKRTPDLKTVVPVRNSVELIKECIHYGNCPEFPLNVDSKINCGLTCTGRNCIHFAGCVPTLVKEGVTKLAKKFVATKKGGFNIYNYDSNAVIDVSGLSIRVGDAAFVKYLENMPSTVHSQKFPMGDHEMTVVRKQSKNERIKPLPHLKKETIKNVAKRCRYCKETHIGHKGCMINLESLRKAHADSIFVKLSPESILNAAQRMNVHKFHSRMFKVIVDGDFVNNAFCFGEKLITTLHGLNFVDAFSVVGCNAVYKLTNQSQEIIDEDLVTYRMNGVSGEKLTFDIPKDGEDCMLLAYDSLSDAAPKISVGVINALGYHTCSSIIGNCGGIIINNKGAIIAIHNGGSSSINKAIPLTAELIKVVQQGFH